MIKIKVNDRQTRAALSNLGKKAGGIISKDSPVPGLIWTEMKIRVDSVFRDNRKGGTARGVTWPYFSPQYTRKTDGVVVPAWGGVAKLKKTATTYKIKRRGKTRTETRMVQGFVKGRLRPSGARVTSASAIMQDTMELRRGAASVLHVGKNRMTIGSDARVGKRASALSVRRPFLFWNEAQDVPMIRGHIETYLARDGNV